MEVDDQRGGEEDAARLLWQAIAAKGRRAVIGRPWGATVGESPWGWPAMAPWWCAPMGTTDDGGAKP